MKIYLLLRNHDFLSRLVSVYDMPKTGAERQREYRERIRKDKEKYASHLEYDRLRKNSRRATMDEEELRKVRSRGKKRPKSGGRRRTARY